MPERNANCPCANTSCPRHGLCGECDKAHEGKTYCKSPKWKQRLVRFFAGRKAGKAASA
ncbi:MAG: hypothetical protein LBD16_05905 [Oscillospiraceae bacterium]|nr:hypothetical protein [Oscillospiraceae bacterium]